MNPKTIRLLLLWLAPLGFLLLFYFFPLWEILGVSFNRSPAGTRFVLDALSLPEVWRTAWFTFWQAALSTLLTLALGLPGAYLLARYDFRGKSLLRAVSGIPFVMPTLVAAAGFNALLGSQGWVNLGLMALFGLDEPPVRFMHTLGAILTAHVFYNTSIVLRVVGDYWARLDPRLGLAAQTLGASRWQALRRITLPLLLPAIAAASLLVFIFNFSSFAVILILGGPRFATLEVEIFYQTTALFNLPLAAVLALLQLACTLALTTLYTRLSAKLSQPGRLKPARLGLMPLNTWQRRVFGGLLVGILLALQVAPLAALAARSVTYFGPERTRDGEFQSGFTLAFYRALGENRQDSAFYAPPARAIAVSTGYAAATVLFSLLLGLPAAWALTHQRTAWLTRLLDPLLMLPLGTSAVTLGLGFIVAFNGPPLNLNRSALLIPLAHTLVAFPFVVRSLAPALASIQPRLRHAAAVLGASPWQVWRAVDLPLVSRAVLTAAAFAFTISLGEFGATVMVSRPEFPTLPMAIYRFLSRPGALNYGQGLALSTLLMLVTAAAMLAIERLRIGENQEF